MTTMMMMMMCTYSVITWDLGLQVWGFKLFFGRWFLLDGWHELICHFVVEIDTLEYWL